MKRTKMKEGCSLAELLEEIEANQFAMALLMPEHQVEKYVKKFCKNGIDVEQEEGIKMMANLFQVSEQLMILRLIKLGYINWLY
ncbi:ImmA/IrrE family metallo-endopeptidase [Anoxybacillus rupiensis]|uniref:ImmA/IrrE family metallo-endopeptidase n=1 Tax=Anoxybacteroides rupiense TaxID=311460 RepID=A0ABD5IZ24_9BACL|nr:ImmA/IrrE family metallo-endopeptidase [Anoxybacillus rupiensis]